MASELPHGKEYEISHAGQTAFVCGSAPCLIPEFATALSMRPEAFIIAINEAASGVWAHTLVSYHCEKFDYFKSLSQNPNIKSHTGKGYRDPKEEIQVDYRWDGIKIGATSAGDAIQIAAKMGFSEIIMIGCPMNGGDGYFKKTHDDAICPRFGAKSTILGENKGMIDSHKATLHSIAQSMDLSMVRSMSGYSSEVFGKPEWR